MVRKSAGEVSGREKCLIAVALFAIVFAGYVVFSSQSLQDRIEEAEMGGIEDLSTAGFVPVRAMADVVDGKGLISLTGKCYRMVAGSDAIQAESIRDAIDGDTGPRPNTHELMRDAFESLGVDLIMVKVTSLKDGNFYGKVILQQGDTILNLDSKPSDGIALAIRMNSTIYFNETLLKERGQKIC